MQKKKEVTIKRETFRNKYYMVHREKGRTVERIRWSSRPISKKGTVNKRMAIDNYKENNSIYEGRRRATGKTWNFVEESRSVPTNYDKIKKGKAPKIVKRNKLKYQYVIEGVIHRKTGAYLDVVAASQQHDPDFPVEDARNEALTSFYERAHFVYMGSEKGHYDANEGIKLVEKGKVEILREGVKQYVPK